MIVVTGGSGVIGRALMARLHEECLPCVSLNRDVLDSAVSMVAAVPHKPSILVHLAALVPQPPMIPDDEARAMRTRDMDIHVLEAVRQWGCHAVYTSGCSLYSKDGTLPKREDEAGTECKPSSAYLATKLQGERDFLVSGHATVLRISTPVGEGLPQSTVMGRFIAEAKAGEELEVWGSGRREQNYVDVVDIADALFRSLVLRPGELINIAADQPITMLELAQQIVCVCRQGIVRMSENPDPREGEHARYSNQKAADLLGWRPTVSIYASIKRLYESSS